MPMFGKDKKKVELIRNLGDLYKKLNFEIGLSIGDFPPIEQMQKILPNLDFSKFKSLNQKLVDRVKEMLNNDIPNLLAMIPQESQVTAEEKVI